jgi:hypothetical protein
MKQIKGNAITYVLEDPDGRILLHCVNCQRTMGSGIAKEVKERVPDAYEAYMEYQIGEHLGEISYNDDWTVANLGAQEYYGYDGKRYVDYGMLAKCLADVRESVHYTGIEYVIPYKMCSDRGGGDWQIVLELCKGLLGEENITIVEFDGSE